MVSSEVANSSDSTTDTGSVLTPATRRQAVITLILGLVAFWSARNPNPEEVERSRIFPGFEGSKVQRLIVERPAPEGEGRETLEFVVRETGRTRRETVWDMVQPVEDKADGVHVQGILAQMGYLDFRDRPLTGARIQELGLDQPTLTVRIERRDGSKLAFAIKTGLANKLDAIRIEGEDRAFLVKPSFAEKLLAPLVEFRRRELFSILFDEAAGLSLTHRAGHLDGAPAQSIDAWRVDGFWHLGRAVAGPGASRGPYADAPTLQALFRDLTRLEAEQVTRRRLDQALLAETGLDAPGLSVAITEADARKGAPGETEPARELLAIGKPVDGEPADESLYYARFGSRPWLLVVRLRALGRRLKELKPADLVSRVLLQLGGAPVTKLDVTAGERRLTLQQRGRRWELEQQPEVAISVDKVKELIEELKSLTVAGKASVTLSAAGLEPPQTRLSVKAGPVTRELLIGAPARLGAGAEPGADGPLVYVARSELPGVKVARLPVLDRLQNMDLRLRDDRLIAFDTYSVDEIKLTDASGEVLRRFTREGRRLVCDGVETLDGKKMDALMAALRDLRAVRWSARATPGTLKRHGLDQPRFRLSVRRRDFDPARGRETVVTETLAIGVLAGEGVRFARVDEDSAIAVIRSRLLDLLTDSFSAK